MSFSLSLVLRIATLLVVSATAACTAPEVAEPTLATTNADYPLETCLVSGGKLGGMGNPVAYTHQQGGQPGRTVMFCCKACIKKFKQEPARYLARLDAAKTAVGAKQN